MEARPIGVMRMIDGGEPDDKIVMVPVEDVRYAEAKDIGSVPTRTRDEVTRFFSTYKPPAGTTSVPGWDDAAKARELIEKAMEEY